MTEGNDFSPRSKTICLLLCFFLGWMGAHRFYTGKIWTGILMALTTGGIVYWSLWGIGIWVVVDLIFILGGAFRDKEGRLIYYWTEKV